MAFLLNIVIVIVFSTFFSFFMSVYYAPDLHMRGYYKMWRGVCPSVRLSVCRVPRPNSRTERPRKPKFGRKPITQVTREPI